jgi:diadenosine tetraphosphate (Ap4A) HIT family hydrolase
MRTWPDDWETRKAGAGCPFCSEGRVARNAYGIRIYRGVVSDAYLQRRAPLPGYTIVVWRGPHIADPADLNSDDACTYGNEVLTVARALRQHFKPAQVNYVTLDLQIPHIHTNVVLRYVDDPMPGGTIDLNQGTQVADDELNAQVTSLRELLGMSAVEALADPEWRRG